MMSVVSMTFAPITFPTDIDACLLTIAEIAELIVRLTGSSSKLVFRPLPKDDPVKRKPDITLAREKLGWQPKVALEDGLKKTIAYFQTVI